MSNCNGHWDDSWIWFSLLLHSVRIGWARPCVARLASCKWPWADSKYSPFRQERRGFCRLFSLICLGYRILKKNFKAQWNLDLFWFLNYIIADCWEIIMNWEGRGYARYSRALAGNSNPYLAFELVQEVWYDFNQESGSSIIWWIGNVCIC